MFSPDVTTRFWAKVDKRAPEGCWLWAASTANGYGQFVINKRHFCAHRVAYMLLVGPIPDGLQLDHLCRIPLCVNPSHLEPVTQKENTLRGLRGRMVTHCPVGHIYDDVNTYVHKGRRNCRTCGRIRAKGKQTAEYWRTYRARRRMAVAS